MDQAVETPMRDLLRTLTEELEAGWRLKADAPNGLAGHVCGTEVGIEVGRILREHIDRRNPT